MKCAKCKDTGIVGYYKVSLKGETQFPNYCECEKGQSKKDYHLQPTFNNVNKVISIWSEACKAGKLLSDTVKEYIEHEQLLKDLAQSVVQKPDETKVTTNRKLRKRIEELEDNITEQVTALCKADKRLVEMEGTVIDYDIQVSDLRNQITTLKNQLKPKPELKDFNYPCIVKSDSNELMVYAELKMDNTCFAGTVITPNEYHEKGEFMDQWLTKSFHEI